MKTEKRKSPEKNKFFTGLIYAVLFGLAWLVIITFAAITIN